MNSLADTIERILHDRFCVCDGSPRAQTHGGYLEAKTEILRAVHDHLLSDDSIVRAACEIVNETPDRVDGYDKGVARLALEGVASVIIDNPDIEHAKALARENGPELQAALEALDANRY